MNNYLLSNLKFLREEQGLTQSEVAQKIGKDNTTIAKWESGDRKPTVQDLIKICKVYNTTVIDLFETDYVSMGSNRLDELDILYERNRELLTEKDRILIKTIIELRLKEIEKELMEE